MGLSKLKGRIVEFLGYWFFAGAISTIMSLAYVWLTGGFANTVAEVAVEVVLARLPFPIDLIAGWSIDPVSIILQFLIFIVIVLLKFRDDIV